MASSKQTLLKISLFLLCCFCVLSERPRREEADPIPDLCQDPSVDAATTTEDGSTYIFKGDYYWELKGVEATFIPKAYPRKIIEDWRGLPGNLDAALTFPDGITLFFKENKYWGFRNKKRNSGYPKEISDGLEGIPNCIDAAVLWSVDGKVYFFKGSKYWLYPSEANSPNPHPISNLEGMPSDIDAAFTFINNMTYFFKGRGYYRTDERIAAVSTHDPALPYPRSNAVWWFGCQSTSNQDFIDVVSKKSNENPVCMDGDGTIRSSTRIPTEKDYEDGSERLTTDLQQNAHNDRTTPSPWNDANSATFSYASLLLTLMLVAIVHSHRG